VRASALPAAVRARFAALGLRATRALAAPHPNGSFAAARSLGVRRALPELYGFHPERILLLEAPDEALAASALVTLAHDALVDWAELNTVRTPALWSLGGAPLEGPGPLTSATLDSTANDPYLRNGRQYALWNPGPTGPSRGVLRADVHAIEAWRRSVGGNHIKLAVADTGIDPAQPELAGTMPDGAPRLVHAFNSTEDPDPSVTDLYGHGTPVAGVMAARTNNGAPIVGGTGVAGVCGGDGAGNAGCQLVPIKIAPGHSGEASSFDIARAFLHAADVGARALNLSFAGEVPSRVERLALTYALYNDCIPVCAAGNSGFDQPTLPLFPACFADIGIGISVGASNPQDRRTLFSSYPFGLDLVAPGEEVYTTFMTYPSFFGATYPGYVPASGTSFSAPHVAGAVGLLAAVRPDLTDNDFQHVIRESAHDIGAPGFDEQTAYGRLDLEQMLARVGPEVGLWHDEIAADSFVTEAEGALTVEERGGGGTLARYFGTSWATRLAAYGTVALPDSFLSVTSAWLRVAGTQAVRGDFRIPYFAPTAEIVRRDASSLTFRGYLYRVNDDSCDVCDDRYVPLAPSNVRFAFSVLGKVDRAPSITLVGAGNLRSPGDSGSPGDSVFAKFLADDPDSVTRTRLEFERPDGRRYLIHDRPIYGGLLLGSLPCVGFFDTPGQLVISAFDEHGHRDQSELRVPFTIRGSAGCGTVFERFAVTPSPFTGALGVFAPAAGRVQVLDASGRLVRELATAGGALHWDGRDTRGASSAAGVYFVRFRNDAGEITKRVVKLTR
jgi:subtilisin family serine protease